MLGVRKYSQEYVDDCRSRLEAQVAAYRALATAMRGVKGAQGGELDAALKAFEPQFFNNMVLALEHSFCHRLRGVEGKDGNPLNESRVLAGSLMENGGKMGVEKTIKLEPAESLLKYEPGERIELDEDDFTLLAQAFLDEIELKFA